jgi:hypothetical protein
MGVISKSAVVSAPSEKILGILLDVESHPSWQKEVQKVEVLESDDQGRPKQTRVSISAMGQNGSYSVRYDYPEPGKFEYRLVEGDMMTKNNASFTLVSCDGGNTEVFIAMDMNVKWALPEFMIDQLTLKGVKDMLKGLKSKAEQSA